MAIKVALVDDHTLVREGVKALLNKTDDIEVVAEAYGGQEGVRLAAQSSADVVIMDLNMPEMNGIEATLRIASISPAASVLFLTTASDRANIMAALKAGAKGYLGKDCSSSELVDAVRAVSSGNSFFCSKVTQVLVDDCRQRTSDRTSPITALSRREQQVLREIADGKNTKDIAFALEVSVKTVETHRLRIMKKLNLHSLPELTKYAVREGLSSLW